LESKLIIGNSEENMKKIISESKKMGSEFILPSGMTLKPKYLLIESTTPEKNLVTNSKHLLFIK
jgi:hypothetical protein